LSCHGFRDFEEQQKYGERLANLPHPGVGGNRHGESIMIDPLNA
jgi:hypothetical protein